MDILSPPEDDPGLGTSHQLIPAKGDDIRALLDGFLNRGFPIQAVFAEVDETSASQVLHDRQMVGMGQLGQFLQFNVRSKTDDPEIARMDLQD